MDELGVLTISLVLFLDEHHDRIKRISLAKRHGCTLREAKHFARKLVKNNDHVALDYVEANWRVDPVRIDLRGSE